MSISRKNLTEQLLPKSATASFAAIKNIMNMGWIEIPPEKKFNGNAAPGDYLEHLLGGKRNNRDSPDLNDWEVKFHGGNALLTLFHKEPEPRGINNKIANLCGWVDDQNRISFRHTLCGKSGRGFYVKNENDRIVVRTDAPDIPVPFWRHNTLLGACSKLKRLILVEGAIETHPIKRVIYRTATAYWDFNLTGFCDAIEQGIICIDFDARTQGGRGTTVRNHGTKFRVNIKNLSSFYLYSKKIT